MAMTDLTATIRAAGGIVHRDGNIFFTNVAQFESAARASQMGEVLHRMKYHPERAENGDEVDWDLYPIDTDECKECFEVLIVRASPPPLQEPR